MEISEIYKTELFRLLAERMKDNEAVNTVFTIRMTHEPMFKRLEEVAGDILKDRDDEHAELSARYAEREELKAQLQALNEAMTRPHKIGDITTELVFKQNGIRSISDLQLVFDKVEKALSETSLRLANEMHSHKVTQESWQRADQHGKEAIARRDDRIAGLQKRHPQIYEHRIAILHNKLFHDDPTDVEERFARLLEEVLELGQALDIPANMIPKLIERTYSRSKGKVRKELGDVAMTFGSLCFQLGTSLSDVAFEGLEDLESTKTLEKVRAKRKTRHGRGLLPGFDPAMPQGADGQRTADSPSIIGDNDGPWEKQETVGDSMRSRDYSTGAPLGARGEAVNARVPDVRTCSEAEWNEHIARTTKVTRAPYVEENNSCEQVAIVLEKPKGFRWGIGQPVNKSRGSQWRGHVVGFYSGSRTPEGYAVESQYEPGNVQVYPVAALQVRYTDD